MDKQRIGAFAEAVYRDMAGAMAIGMGYIGQRTGLFNTLASAGAVSSEELAESTGLHSRYVEEWLKGMTAAGWLQYDAGEMTFSLPAEHAFLLASEGTDHFMGGLFLAGPALLSQAPKVTRAFKEGGGVAFGEYDDDWIDAMDLMNGGPYEHRLASYWMEQIPEVAERLNSGGRILDIGCGVGRVAEALAKAYPDAEIVGVDPDEGSIEKARTAVGRDATARVQFVTGTIRDIPAEPAFDFATLFDCLHDLTDPVETLADIRARLRPDAVLMVLEPRGADRLEDNVNPLGTTYYGFSLFHCMTQSLAQGGPGLGTCMGPEATMALLKDGGFTAVEQLPIKSQTNLFYAARP